MQRSRAGYTLVEVMVFLAVSSVLLAMSIVVVRGQEGHTEFTSSMNDVNSKIQHLVDGVVNGLSGSTASATASDYNCKVEPSSGYAYLDLVGPGQGSARGANPECISLGLVIQVNDDRASPQYSNQITTYTVIGRRTYQTDAGTTDIVDNLVSAKPVAAVFPPPVGIDLTQTYKIPNGARILSVSSTNSGGVVSNSHMAGFFNSFNSEANSFVGGGSNLVRNGNLSLLTVQYPLADTSPGLGDATKCIKLDPTTNCVPPIGQSNLWPMNTWQICFGSTRNDDKARLTFSSTNGLGASTKLEFVASCP